MTEYRMVGTHATEVAVGDNVVMLGPGEFVDLDDDAVKANKELISEGVLLNTEKEPARKTSNESELENPKGGKR